MVYFFFPECYFGSNINITITFEQGSSPLTRGLPYYYYHSALLIQYSIGYQERSGSPDDFEQVFHCPFPIFLSFKNGWIQKKLDTTKLNCLKYNITVACGRQFLRQELGATVQWSLLVWGIIIIFFRGCSVAIITVNVFLSDFQNISESRDFYSFIIFRILAVCFAN